MLNYNSIGYTMETLGFRDNMLYTSGAMAVCVLLGAVYFPVSVDKAITDDDVQEKNSQRFSLKITGKAVL